MTRTPRSRNTTITTSEKIAHKWSLAVSYWAGQEITETFAVGQTRGATLKNWFFQYYQGDVPENPRFPSPKDIIFLSWVEFVPAE
jgi:hypothetical protein